MKQKSTDDIHIYNTQPVRLKPNGSYEARIRWRKGSKEQCLILGTFATEEDARLGYDVGIFLGKGKGTREEKDIPKEVLVKLTYLQGREPTPAEVIRIQTATLTRHHNTYIGLEWRANMQAIVFNYCQARTRKRIYSGSIYVGRDITDLGELDPAIIAKAQLYRACAVHLDPIMTEKEKEQSYYHAKPTEAQLTEYKLWRKELVELTNNKLKTLINGGVARHKNNQWGIWILIAGYGTKFVGVYGTLDNINDRRKAERFHDCAVSLEKRIVNKKRQYLHPDSEPSAADIAEFNAWYRLKVKCKSSANSSSANSSSAAQARESEPEEYEFDPAECGFLHSAGDTFTPETNPEDDALLNCESWVYQDLQDPISLGLKEYTPTLSFRVAASSAAAQTFPDEQVEETQKRKRAKLRASS